MAGPALRSSTGNPQPAGGQERDALTAPEVLDALRASATVLDQHAEALDGLAVALEWGPELGAVDGALDPEVDGRIDAVTRSSADAVDPGPGSDLAATLGSACDAAAGAAHFSDLCRGLSDGAHAAASGDAGRHLAGFLGGAGDALRNADRVGGMRLALAMEAGAERVTEGDDGGHPGRLLAVMSAAADGALAASDSGADVVEVLVSAAEAGLVELEQGPVADAQLSERGTVDAAAAGFLLVLDSLAAYVAGDPLPEPPRTDREPPTVSVVASTRFAVRGRITPIDPGIEAAADLEAVIHELSERSALDRVEGHWNVAAITTLPGAVVEAMAAAGRLAEMHVGLDQEPT